MFKVGSVGVPKIGGGCWFQGRVDGFTFSSSLSFPLARISAHATTRPPHRLHPSQLFGVDLAKLINVDKKEFVFNEFGIGGGASVSGDQPARTVVQAADGPFFGVYGPYTRKLDPWRLFLPSEWVAV